MLIIISRNEKDVKMVGRTSFKKEEDLLEYIFKTPDCIPLEDLINGC
jgi:hypothetical protein